MDSKEFKRVYIVSRDEVPSGFTLSEGEKLDVTLVVLPGTTCEIPLRVELVGPGAEAVLRGVYLCPGEENVRIKVDMRHLSGSCTSRQLFKGVVGGKASVVFDGLIYVQEGAQKTKAYQENHNILLSSEARAETRPQLEIYADDVECSHGATVGRLSEDELFYMRSRGIPEDLAKALQIRSFISEVVQGIDDEDLREMIYDKLSQC